MVTATGQFKNDGSLIKGCGDTRKKWQKATIYWNRDIFQEQNIVGQAICRRRNLVLCQYVLFSVNCSRKTLRRSGRILLLRAAHCSGLGYEGAMCNFVKFTEVRNAAFSFYAAGS